MKAPAARRGESRVLYQIISTVASSLDLDEVLAAVVRLLSDASAVHACFVYLLDDRGKRLVLKAASGPYSHLVDQIRLERGIAWWAAAAPLPIGSAATAFAPGSAHAIALSSVIAVLAIWWGLCVRGAFSRKREPRERWAFALGALALVWAVVGVLLAAAR